MFICALIALIPFFRGKALLRFCRPRFHLQMFHQILSCGSPNFLNNNAGRITSILMNAILVRLGGTMAVSVYGILMFADGFIQPLLYGMCDSLQPAVGYNWGARKFSRVRAIERCCFLASAIISVLSALALFAAPEQIYPAVCSVTRSGTSGSGCHGTAAVFHNISHPVVFLCHPELYAGSRKTSPGHAALCIHCTDLSGDSDR